MDVHLPLSATIKVVKMEHKKKKITMGFALLLCAMVALVGVGYALAYQGSANTNIDDATGELVTVGIAKTGFTDGEIYTVDTSNNGTNVTVSNLKKTGETATPYNEGHFTYSAGEFTWATGAPAVSPASGVYYASKVGQITLTINQTEGATATVCSLSATSSVAMPSYNENGLSLVYTYKVGNGTETVFTPGTSSTVIDDALNLTNEVTVLVTAYVVYHSYVASGSIATIVPFTLPNATLTFTVDASTPAVNPAP